MLSETEHQLKKIVRESKKEFLLPQEKEAIKSHLIHFIKANPAVIGNTHLPAAAVYQNKNFWSLYFANIVGAIYKKPALRYVSLVAMVVLVGGGSIAFAAQNAQPGQLLYPVKTGVSEKVLALTLFSNQAKAEYTINLAQLRLQETETAAAQGKLNPETSAEVRQLFSNHVLDIQTRIEALNAKEGARVSIELNSQLEALLKAHANIIDNLAGKNQDSQAEAIKHILSDVKDKTAQIKNNREKGESALVLQVSRNAKVNAQNKLLQAEAAVREAEALLVGADISDSSRQKAEADLAMARQSIIDGKQALEAEEYVAAFITLQNAVRTAHQINIAVATESKLRARFNLPASLLQKDALDANINLETKLQNIINR